MMTVMPPIGGVPNISGTPVAPVIDRMPIVHRMPVVHGMPAVLRMPVMVMVMPAAVPSTIASAITVTRLGGTGTAQAQHQAKHAQDDNFRSNIHGQDSLDNAANPRARIFSGGSQTGLARLQLEPPDLPATTVAIPAPTAKLIRVSNQSTFRPALKGQTARQTNVRHAVARSFTATQPPPCPAGPRPSNGSGNHAASPLNASGAGYANRIRRTHQHTRHRPDANNGGGATRSPNANRTPKRLAE